MANIYKGTLGLIGGTPLVEAVNIEKALGLEATILMKLEYFNPAGSVKDPGGKRDDRGCRKPGNFKTGRCDYRAHIGKYGNRTGGDRCGKGLSDDSDDAGNDEC